MSPETIRCLLKFAVEIRRQVGCGPDGKRVEFGRLLLKQDLRPRRMQGFHLHVNQPGDYIQDNQVFADAVHRILPWIKTPQDVIRFLDRRLVFASVHDFNRGLIRAAPVEDFAAQVLGPSPVTAPFFDLTRQHAEIYPGQLKTWS